MTYSISDVIPEVRRFVKNCPDITIQYAIRRAVQEFCRESWCYQKTVQITPVADQEAYPLSILNYDDVLQVKHVMYNNVAITKKRGQDSLPPPMSSGGNQPYEFIFEPPNILLMHPVPSNVINPSTGDPYEVFVRLVLVPKDAQDHVPDVIYNFHKQQLAEGAIAYCMLMPQEVWTNPEQAQMHIANFKYGYNEAKRRQQSGNTEGRMRIRPRSFLTGGN
jgi:hypothetical protein